LIPSLPSRTGPVAKTGESYPAFNDPVASSLLSVGEELSASVVQRHSVRQYIVALKDRVILADSATSLKVGDTLRLRVEQQYPQLVLRVLAENTAQKEILLEHVRFFRANPEGLLGNLSMTETLLTQAIVHPRLTPLLRHEIETILKLIQALRYPGTAMDGCDYLRAYPTNIGLLMETHVKRALGAMEERGMTNDRASGGLKELLLHLTGNICSLLTDDTLPEGLRLTLEQTRSSAEKMVETIENQQIINAMLQETEHTYLLQIPLLVPGGMKLSGILIREDDRSDRASRGFRSFAVSLFFDLDMLGHVLIELRITNKQIGCVCKSEETAVLGLISSRLPELQEKLFAGGYRVERLSCVLEKDLSMHRLILQSDCNLYSAESINLFV
jgi:hypothetical protein